MARKAREMMAEMRALEEQEARESVMSGGAGATPSMGVSQKRGGRKRMTKGEVSASMAKEQGRALAEHLHSLHGGAYMKDFQDGMAMAGGAMHCMVGGLGTGKYEGEGALEIEVKHSPEEKKKMKGGMSLKRLVGGGEDRRKKRAEVVKKVMAEQGLSMIEASKFVKERGLF